MRNLAVPPRIMTTTWEHSHSVGSEILSGSGVRGSCSSCRSFRNTDLANSRYPNKHIPFILLVGPFILKAADTFYIFKLKTK